MRFRSLLFASVCFLPWWGCMGKAPIRKPPAPPVESLESHLMGSWQLRGRDGKIREMVFGPDGALTFRGGLEFYNPAQWTLIENRHELILTFLHAPDEKLDIFHTYIGDGVKSFNRDLKEVTYAFDHQTWSLNVAGWIYSKPDQPAAPREAEPVFR